jgi:hypothetical protein
LQAVLLPGASQPGGYLLVCRRAREPLGELRRSRVYRLPVCITLLIGSRSRKRSKARPCTWAALGLRHPFLEVFGLAALSLADLLVRGQAELWLGIKLRLRRQRRRSCTKRKDGIGGEMVRRLCNNTRGKKSVSAPQATERMIGLIFGISIFPMFCFR